MPIASVDGRACYYRLDGVAGRPVVVFAHSLGLDHAMWDAQAADLLPYFQVLRVDIRGHGASAAPPGEYRIEALAADVLGVADALGIDRFAFCGISLGGMIGQWIGIHAPERLSALVLANTAPGLIDPSAMEARRQAVLGQGMSAVAETVLGRFFSPERVAAGGAEVASARQRLLATSPQGYAGCCAAIRDVDFRADLGRISVPTLIVSGDRDISMPWEGHSSVLAAAIPGARVVRLPAAHLSNLECPRAFSAALCGLLLPSPSDRAAGGMTVRRRVLGDAHVDRAVAGTTPFTMDFQALITEYAWGTIWTRPGLDQRTRRLIVLAVTAALGRLEEFRLHVRAGLAHELEACDVEEVLLQVAVYAGVPAANTAFHIASEEMTAAG